MKASALIALLIATLAQAAVVPADNVVSLDGTWRFKLEQAKGEPNFAKGERGKIPIDYPEKFEPFYTPDYKEDDKWHDLAVPGNWEMAGHSPRHLQPARQRVRLLSPDLRRPRQLGRPTRQTQLRRRAERRRDLVQRPAGQGR